MAGLPADLQVVADGMLSASMEMVDSVMIGVRDTTLAVFHELDRQEGMAGDDDAGRDFAKVYTSAAAETLDQMGFSAFMMGESGTGLMRSAREFIAQEDATAASFMARQPDPTVQMGDPSRGCSERFVGLGEDLPKVVGKTSWNDQYLGTGDSGGRFRGSPEKLRDVASTWTRAGTLLQQFLVDAQGCGHTADKAHSGQAADAFRAHFKAFVGFGPAPALAQSDEPLAANLVAACDQLAQACTQYASHIEQALSRIRENTQNPFHMDAPWHDPLLGGNGDDGGLRDLVDGDPWIHALGDVAHALDASRSRVKIPGAGRHLPWYDPFPLLPLPVPIPEPAVPPLVLASAPGLLPAIYRPINPAIPFRPPIPALPGTTTPLTPAEQQAFTAWANGLQPADFGGTPNPADPANAYQLRVAGYPERIVPFTEHGVRRTIAADGVRATDGYMVDAKYVADDNRCFRKPSTLLLEQEYKADGTPKWNPNTVLVGKDHDELAKYHAAIDQNDQVRGLEIVTNSRDAVAYWQTLMSTDNITGTVQYQP